jgi:hypothetical protein
MAIHRVVTVRSQARNQATSAPHNGKGRLKGHKGWLTTLLAALVVVLAVQVAGGGSSDWDKEKKCALSQSGCVSHCMDVGRSGFTFCDGFCSRQNHTYCPGVFNKLVQKDSKEQSARYGN